MPRLIAAVVLGYLAMALAVFAGLSVAYLGLGADRAFRAGVFDVSTLWAFTSLVVGFGAALLGGWVARRMDRTARGPRALAGLVVVLGIALALPALLGEPAALTARAGTLGPFEAMQQARTPLWLMLLNPVVGAVGVLLGGRALAEATHPGAPTAAGQPAHQR
jgi:hypothetical protein